MSFIILLICSLSYASSGSAESGVFKANMMAFSSICFLPCISYCTFILYNSCYFFISKFCSYYFILVFSIFKSSIYFSTSSLVKFSTYCFYVLMRPTLFALSFSFCSNFLFYSSMTLFLLSRELFSVWIFCKFWFKI